MEQKKTSFVKNILSFFKPFWKPMTLLVFIMIIGQLIGAFSPYLFGKGVDAITHGEMRLTFIFIICAFGLSLLQTEILSWAEDLVMIKMLGDKIEKAISVKSMERMFGFSVGQHVNEHSGVKQTIVNKGQSALINLMYNTLQNILPNIFQIIVLLVVLTIFDWTVAVIAAFFVIFYIVISYKRNVTFFPKQMN